ncbi:MAG: leucine-rich repeat domain-containing protein, partial [Ketobacteraceae bacterium]|nr:leucine-rich repeat domain-containing protein [Ketobacteraceae bacterium]
ACLLLVLKFLSGCQANIDFTIDQEVDDEGNDFATISWDVQPVGRITPTRVTLEPGFGDVDFTGSVQVAPAETTEYRLTVYAQYEDGRIANTVVKGKVYVGPRVDYRLFTDTRLRECAGASEFTHIEQFSTLVCTDQGIESIQGISQLSELKLVTLDLNNISDLSPLAGLDQVHTLSITNNDLTSLATLPAMPALENLVLFNNGISDISPLMENPQLLNLAINNNQISDAAQFAILPNLTNLSVRNNLIEDIGPIGELSALQNLDARYNILKRGVWDLRSLENAIILDLRGNGDIKCLEYANLALMLGKAVLFNDCTFPPPGT